MKCSDKSKYSILFYSNLDVFIYAEVEKIQKLLWKKQYIKKIIKKSVICQKNYAFFIFIVNKTNIFYIFFDIFLIYFKNN